MSDTSTTEMQPSKLSLRTTNLMPPFNRLVGVLPKSVLSVPSMMSVAERRFLYGLAARYYEGEGLIVDAGIFLGASTRCFGEGLHENPNLPASVKKWQRPIVSFERGIVTPTMPLFFKRNGLEFSGAPGDSFSDLVQGNIAPVVNVVELRLGDIQETGAINHPIEILFLDVLKLPEINKFVVENYYSRLIPGRSIVIQQDYFYDLLPYVKTYQEALSEYFTFVGEIGSTAVFLCKKQIPQEATLRIEERLDASEQLRLSAVALQRSTDPARRFLMALSRARLIRKLQGAKAAQAYLEFVRSEYPEEADSERSPRLREALRGAEIACRAKGAPIPEAADADI
ncbi:hypothetical protein LJ725_22210 [Reyranella aquatilis]|jgi:hypothetical protein|uniref:Uncharacterized protein n=1 Tax=Reyranella aquatilis TaxID=2035356 RepID=A0ABS8L018_9HYPH|nr:hypothetical protein [Reyranella aquatilis]MCC8431699.1 hypothetical protein [Reyranella aquatilis]